MVKNVDESIPYADLIPNRLTPHPVGTEKPREWTDDPRRVFLHRIACETCKGSGTVGGYSGSPDEWEDNAFTCGTCDATGVDPSSPIDESPDQTHLHALNVAPAATLRTEAAAWELSRRLQPWGVGTVDRLRWRCGPRDKPRLKFHSHHALPVGVGPIFDDLLFRHWHNELKPKLSTVDLNELEKLQSTNTNYDNSLWILSQQAKAHMYWKAAQESGCRIPADYTKPWPYNDGIIHPNAGRAVSEFANPYTPLLHISLNGFIFDGFADSDAVLYAPLP